MSIIQINGKTYSENALKRQICKVCAVNNYPNLDTFFWRAKFTDEIENLHHIPEYEDIKGKSYKYLCHRCMTELIMESPEVIAKVTRVFPK